MDLEERESLIYRYWAILTKGTGGMVWGKGPITHRLQDEGQKLGVPLGKLSSAGIVEEDVGKIAHALKKTNQLNKRKEKRELGKPKIENDIREERLSAGTRSTRADVITNENENDCKPGNLAFEKT